MEITNSNQLYAAPGKWIPPAWNQTQAEFPLHSLPDLFTDQVVQTPDAIAVQSGAQALTYAALNERSNQVAHCLQAHGIHSESHVAICLERSPDLIIAILGTLKAGGAYIPLDPAYPADRLNFMLADSNASVLITSGELYSKFAQFAGHVICIDMDWPDIQTYSTTNPTETISPHNLAYIIYTSGSTGQPKGVMVEQVGWANYVRSARETYGLRPGERVLQFASISWDTSAEEIFPCLTSGATLVLRTPEMVNSIPSFLQACADWKINVINIPTAFWHELATQLTNEDQAQMESLRVVIIGGERAHLEILTKWWDHAPTHIHLFNTYGQTECTAVTTCVELTPELTAQFIPVGKPVQNVRTYILDEHLAQVSIGQSGELYVGGAGLARGYFNQPDLTAQKFIPNPFEPAERLYKTGDLMRYWPDGNLEFIGRADNQVKLRGIRIEPGEVEGILLQHPAVKNAAVIGYPLGPSPEYLAAYVVLKPNISTPAVELRQWMTERVPTHLVPSVIVPLEALPLTPNGKLDRRALPEPGQVSIETSSDYAPPRDELELKLVHLWEQLLERKPIGIHDNFFEVGGHSLLVVRLMTQLEREFNKSLSMVLIFHAPTVAQMAAVLRDQGWKSTWSSLVPIRSQGDLPPLFCVHADGGAFFYARFGDYLSPRQPFYGLQARGLDGAEPPFTRVEDMAAHYLAEIRSIQPTGPYIISGFSMGGVVVYEMAQQLVAAGEEYPLVIFLDAPSPIYYEEQDTRVSGKLINLTRLSPRDQFQKLQLRLSQRFRWLRDEYLGRLLLKLNLPLTPALRIHRVRELNQRISDEYKPKPYPGPVTVLRASQQIRRAVPDPTLGWGQSVCGEITTYTIPGDHETIFHEPNVKVMAQTLQACIDQARAARTRQ